MPLNANLLQKELKISLDPCDFSFNSKSTTGGRDWSSRINVSLFNNDERMSVVHQDSGGIGKSIPSALEISRGRGFSLRLRLREIPWVSWCKTHGRGKSRGRRGWISQYLPSFGGVRTFSQHLFFYREWIRKSFPVGREGLTVLKSILPCR